MSALPAGELSRTLMGVSLTGSVSQRVEASGEFGAGWETGAVKPSPFDERGHGIGRDADPILLELSG